MENKFEATTVEMDGTGYSDLKDQILNRKNEDSESNKEEKKPNNQGQQKQPYSKKHIFRKADQTVELDDDFEIEIMADKRPMKLTLRELKDRAAGDIAVKNRMHSLAEEKKRVQSTFKQFTEIAKKDPIAALEYISNKAHETDSEFEYTKYLKMLSDQAEQLEKMDEKDRKNWEIQRKLEKAEQDLSHKEREKAVVLRKQGILADYPEIGDSQFGQMVDAILDSDELSEGLENESDVMDKVEELIQETLTQQDIMSVIRDINPRYLNDNELIFSLSNQLQQNPDLDEEDVRDILRELIQPDEKVRPKPVSNERDKDIRTLSSKAREANSINEIRSQNFSHYDDLKQQLLERKQELSKTPIYKR